MLMERYARANFAGQQDFEQNFKIDVPENYNFAFDCIDELAARQPDKTALVWCNDQGAQATYSFSQLAAGMNAAARYFASLGVAKGDRVMLMLKRRAQYWFVFLGLMKLGAVAIPATHQLTKKDIVYRCNAANVAAIVAADDDMLLDSITQALPEAPTVRHLVCLNARGDWQDLDRGMQAFREGAALPRVTKNNDMMMLYFTSGTTGMPKMVAHNHAYPLAHIATARFWHNLHPGSLHLTVADTGWAKCAWGKMFGQWLCEAAVFVYDHERFNAKELLEVVARHKVTSFCAPPTVYRFLIKEDLSDVDLSHLEYVTTAGEPLNPEVFQQFKDATGLELHECYGQTETTPLVITSPYMRPRPGSLGRPSPAYDLVLLDADGNEVPPGEEGEICVRTGPAGQPGVFMGYQQDDLLNERAWRFGVYHTGDIARLDADGYLWFIGRGDDVIKSSGYRIGPFEVESVLMEHPAVLECAITGIPDAVRGQVVKATVVLAKGFEASKTLMRELQDFVKRNTAPYKYPRVVEFVKTLPKTISGKIQRAVIRENERTPQARPRLVAETSGA